MSQPAATTRRRLQSSEPVAPCSHPCHGDILKSRGDMVSAVIPKNGPELVPGYHPAGCRVPKGPHRPLDRDPQHPYPILAESGTAHTDNYTLSLCFIKIFSALQLFSYIKNKKIICKEEPHANRVLFDNRFRHSRNN
jgi:hypothetical protein